jgi:inorganic pyrophosphatase
MLVEIPAGTSEKWELNKTTGKVERDSSDGKPRTIAYMGYPGNYGMVPGTLLAKADGGDGDPLDVISIGPPAKRGSTIQTKVIGVLRMLDRGERDDKLIAVQENSPLFHCTDIDNLDHHYPGISDILEIWFTSYKGPQTTVSAGFENVDAAGDLLERAYTFSTQSNPDQ